MYFESENEWLFYHLWTKKSPRAPIFSFKIPDTVVLRQGEPAIWYFNSKEGYILRKNQNKLVPQRIVQKFHNRESKCEELPNIQAYHYIEHGPVAYSQRCDLLINYIGYGDVKPYLLFNLQDETQPQPNLIQKFVIPKQSHNHVLRVQWTPSSCVIDRLTNKHSMYDGKHSLEARTVTFEGLEVYTKREVITSGPVFEFLYKSMWQIHNHIKRNSEVSINSGQFFFKMDHQDCFYLLYATCIKADKPIRVLNGNKSLGLGLLQMSNHINQLQETDQQREYHQYSVKNYEFHQDSSREIPASDFKQSLETEHLVAPRDSIKTGSTHVVTNVSINKKIGPKVSVAGLTGSQPASSEVSQNDIPRGSLASSVMSSFNPNSCPFCLEGCETEASRGFELSANQIIKLYDHYEINPNNLLLLTAENEKQVQFYEDMYGQLTYASKQQEAQFSQQSINAQRVPRPISRVFGVNSFQKYLVMKNDPAFIYRPIKICDVCYQAIKNLVAQSEFKSTQFGFSPTSGEKMQQSGAFYEKDEQSQKTPSTPSDSEFDKDSKLDDGMIQEEKTKSAKKGNFVMFSKVEAGKEVESNDVSREEPRAGKSSAKDQVSCTTKTEIEAAQSIGDVLESVNVQLSVKAFQTADSNSAVNKNMQASENGSEYNRQISREFDKMNAMERDMIDASRRLKMRGKQKPVSALAGTRRSKAYESQQMAKTVIKFVKDNNLPVIDVVNKNRHMHKGSFSAKNKPPAVVKQATFSSSKSSTLQAKRKPPSALKKSNLKHSASKQSFKQVSTNDPLLQTDYRIFPESQGPNTYIEKRPQFLSFRHQMPSERTASNFSAQSLSQSNTRIATQPNRIHHQYSSSTLPVQPLIKDGDYQLSGKQTALKKVNRPRPFSAKQDLVSLSQPAILTQTGQTMQTVQTVQTPGAAPKQGPFVYSKFDVARIYLNATGSGLPPRPQTVKKPKRVQTANSLMSHKHTQEQIHYYLLMEEAARAQGMSVEQYVRMQASNGFSMGSMSQTATNFSAVSSAHPTNLIIDNQKTSQGEQPVSGLGGMLNFNQMSENDIKMIAANADNLIQIIQNIKDKAAPISESVATSNQDLYSQHPASQFPAIDESSGEETKMRQDTSNQVSKASDLFKIQEDQHTFVEENDNMFSAKATIISPQAATPGQKSEHDMKLGATAEAFLKDQTGQQKQEEPLEAEEPEEDELAKQMAEMQNQKLPKQGDINENWW